MINPKTFISKYRIATALLIVALFVVFETILQATLYNPAVMVPVLRVAYTYHIFQPLLSLESHSAPYPLLRIKDINNAKYFGPRASVIGVVTDIQRSFDGDWHLNITARDGTVLVKQDSKKQFKNSSLMDALVNLRLCTNPNNSSTAE